MNKKPTSPVVKGLIIAALLIVFSVIVAVFKYQENKILGLVPVIIMLVGIIWACLSYSKDMYGNVTFGNIFAHGFKASALIAGIMAIFILLMITVIFPESLDQELEKVRKEMAADKKISAQDLERNMRFTRKAAIIATPPIMVLMYLGGGAIAALIGAAVAKKTSNPVPFDQIDQPIS